MKKVYILFFLLLSLFTLTVNAQNSAYKQAEKLANEAIDQLKAGEFIFADSLIKKSIDLYPVYDVIEYSKLLVDLPDLLTANSIMNALKSKVESMRGTIWMVDPNDVFMGVKAKKTKEYEKSRAHFRFLTWIYEVNRIHGNRSYILSSLEDLQSVNINNVKGFDVESILQDSYKITYRMYLEDYAGATALLDKSAISLHNPKELTVSMKIWIDVLKQDYDSALAKTTELSKSKLFATAADSWFFNIYALLGDDRALKYYEKINKEPTINKNGLYYTLALYYKNKKDYATALSYLDKSDAMRKEKVQIADMIVESWNFYKAYGDVYTGLKQFEKARTNYEIALLYYPEDKSILKSVSDLNARVSAETSIDKTGPEIHLTEPTTNRGLKVVTASSNIMIRGVAKDVSEVAEVTINGIKVYNQQDGVFWGDVPLKNGINTILVAATDVIGNKTEQTFDIEKSAPNAVNAPSTIVAVSENKGKNYSLLIAAQNYDDSSILSLENPVADAIRLKMILNRDYGFDEADIITLLNPTSSDLRRKLLELTNKIKPEDNILIFYAGHGIWVDKEKKGYWLMTDAQYNNSNTWTANKEVLDLISKLPARNTLLITDACFSGSVFKTRGIQSSPPVEIKALESKISRVAITSGNDTEVPDVSVFMKYLIKALHENKEKYLSAQKMFVNQIIEAVMKETNTEPRYGTLEMAGHVGGDFIFTRSQ